MKEFNVEKFLEERNIPVDDLTDDLLLAIDEAYRQGYNQCLLDFKEMADNWKDTK